MASPWFYLLAIKQHIGYAMALHTIDEANMNKMGSLVRYLHFGPIKSQTF